MDTLFMGFVGVVSSFVATCIYAVAVVVISRRFAKRIRVERI